MSDSEAPLTPVERLAIVGLYVTLSQSQNRPSLGRQAIERPCYADLNIRGPETLSRKRIPDTRVAEGIETC